MECCGSGKDAIMELIKCPICLEVYSDPRMLPCQHSFCRCCLERLAENDGRWGRCPQCRQVFRIPFNGVASFDVNRTIAQLIETLPKQQSPPERPVLHAKCASCRKEEIITTCEHCKEALCKPCRVDHFNSLKLDLEAQLTKLEAESDKLIIKEVESISRHEVNLTKCKEIRDIIQKKVNDIIKRLREEESRLLEDVDDFERTENNLLADKNARLKDLESMSLYSTSTNKALLNKEETDEEVMNMAESCKKQNAILDEFTSELATRYMTRLISFFDRDMVESFFSLGYVETVTQHQEGGFMNGQTTITANNPTTGIGISVFSDEETSQHSNTSNNQQTTHLDEKCETLEMQLKQTHAPKRQNNSFNRRIRCSNSNNILNNHSIKYATPSSNQTNLSHSNTKLNSMPNTNSNNNNNNSTKFKSLLEPRKFFQPYKVIGSEGEGSSEFRHPLGVAVSPIDGHIFVADSWNNRLQRFDENGLFVKSLDKIGLIDFFYPYSVHIDKKGRVYVSDQSLIRIKVFDSQFNFIRVIGRYGREVGCYSGLCDISTDSENNVYVCDSGNHRIIKFTENGEFLSQWGSNGSAEGLFKCPACVTVHDERVFVSDWGNHRVQVFTLDGKFLRQIGRQGTGMGEFRRPLGVAIDDKGNIVIVDEGNNRLQIFKSDFVYHSKISGLKCDFQRPWDVAITKNGGIVVSEYYGHRLQIL